MQDVISFWTALFGALAEFLMTEPIVWFTVIFLSLAIAGLIRNFIGWR